MESITSIPYAASHEDYQQKPALTEITRAAVPGWLALLVIGGLFAFDLYMAAFESLAYAWLLLLILFLLKGLLAVEPNEGRVLQFFGRYVGTIRTSGFQWVNPLFSSGRISLRVRNFETERTKVNDLAGNPIEVSAVVVWKVNDTAQASFEVDDCVDFVKLQSESAVRNLATQYPYDTREAGQMSLRSDTDAIASKLQTEIQSRLQMAGVCVIEARITHLAYAPEIAAVMLQRQQASAIVAARTELVEGAVGMVEMALDRLSDREIVDLDEERKATMVSNLLVVLCSEKGTRPVVNAGTLYQ